MKYVPLLVKAGGLCGMLAGGVAGAVLDPGGGAVVGAAMGLVLGVTAGIVMDRDDKRASQRTRELDEIIGVTSGSLGAPKSVPPPEQVEKERELAAWVTEWMTPLAPGVRGASRE